MSKERPSWYVDRKFIREKVRHTWTDEERKKIYTLRKEGQSVDNIIYILKLNGLITRTKVYNIIRSQKSFLLGKCTCGTPLKRNEIIAQLGKTSPKCAKCLRRSSIIKRRLRRSYLKKGLCGVCGEHPVVEGHKTCKLCLSADYRRCYVNHICGRCHDRPISKKSKVFCDVCLETNRKNTSEYRKKVLDHANHT